MRSQNSVLFSLTDDNNVSYTGTLSFPRAGTGRPKSINQVENVVRNNTGDIQDENNYDGTGERPTRKNTIFKFAFWALFICSP